MTGYITGSVIVNDSTAIAGNITGNATFYDTSYNSGNITGNATFNDYSFNGLGGGVSDNCTFAGFSYNNGGAIYGTAIIRQHAADFIAWRNYATSTYITTLTLQFPEMDVLGTGLL